MPSCRLFQQPSNHYCLLLLSSKKSNGLLSCVTRSSSSKQFQIGNKRYQVGPIDLKLFFLTQKIHFPTAGHDVHWAFFTEAAVVIDIFCIRYLSSGPKRALYHRLFSNVPSIRCLSTVQTKNLLSKILDSQLYFQDFSQPN